MSLIELKDISVSYGGDEVLSDVSLTVCQNDFLGVIGPNGGGKTTLVKTILDAVTFRGSVIYDDSLIVNKRKLIGYLPQQNNFDMSFPISVKETVLSGLQSERGLFLRYGKKESAKAESLIEMIGINNVKNSPIGEISGGQMQRTLLCRALISDPRLLILDEPANFVDNKFEKELYEILRKLNDRMAIIMVSHDVGSIIGVVKDIVCVNRYVHRHDPATVTAEQFKNYDCTLPTCG